MTNADRQRRWRERQSAAEGRGLGPPGRPPAACPSASGYNRHRRNGEPVCDGCRQAYNAAQRSYYQRRKA